MHMCILFYARGCIILLTDFDTSCTSIYAYNEKPIDRNGNFPSMHMNLNIYNRFAEHTSSRSTEHGIAVLSYDKRGVGKSKNPNDKNFYYRAGMYDFVNDAVEAVRFLSQHPRM